MAKRHGFGGWLRLAALLAGAAVAQVAAQPSNISGSAAPRLSGDWQAGPRVLIGIARPPFPQAASDLAGTDLGAAPSGARLDRMLLLLEPSSAQRAALDTELAQQQNPQSSEYHHWLTPSEFADKYSNAASDVAATVAWLQSEGLKVAPLPAGRGWIEFSGTVAQVEQAFQAGARSVAGGSGVRLAMADSISVPAALRPLIHGLVSVDGVIAAPAVTTTRSVVSPAAELRAANSITGTEAVTPQLAAQMLHLDVLHGSGATGAGETIAIAARSNIQIQDVAAFRSAFGLAANPVEVVLEGADPGRGSVRGDAGDEAEAVMAASWAGAAAPGARIVLVPAATTGATDGLDLSLAAIVDQNMAHTVTVGFSACEALLSEARQAFYGALYRQAAAEGIAMVAASGDSGASACHASGSQAAVTSGYGVNALGSTPWNIAVGTAAISGVSSKAGSPTLAGWSPRTPADPEYAGGGGASAIYAVPAWQPLPAGNSAGLGSHARLMPDLALPTALDSGVNRGLVFCLSGGTSGGSCNLVRGGGSAAAAALFSGVAAILAQKNGPLGNPSPEIYELSRRAGVFEDVEQGNARLACAAGSLGCDASGRIGFDAAAGYDLATGLGSIDAQKLVNEWATAAATGTGATSVILMVTPQAQNNTYNPSAQLTFNASVSSLTGGATPAGTVTFSDATSNGTITIGGAAVTLDSNGKASVTVPSGSAGENGLSSSGNNVTAIYSGDVEYAANVSTPPFGLTIAKSQTTPSISAPSAVAAGASFTATVTIAGGTPAPGSLPPGGAVTMAVDGVATATANLSTTGVGPTSVTSATFTLTAPTSSGSHNLQATYPGDANYQSSVKTVSFTISKGATVTTLAATPGVLTPGTTETLTATVAPLNPGTTTATITGTVSFFDGSALLGTATLASNTATLDGLALSTVAAHSITAVYSGDASWSPSSSNAVILVALLLPDSVTLTVSPGTVAPGQVVTLIATVTPAAAPGTTSEQNPTGNVIFYNGSVVIGTVALVAGPNHTSTATMLNATLPGGTDVIYAFYVGDAFYLPGTSNSITISVLDFVITPAPTNPPTNLNIVKGSSGSASFIISGVGGFNNQVQVVCAVPAQDDMTCLPSPQQVMPTATITFTVQTFAAGGITAANGLPAQLWPRALGGTALAALMFFVLPYRQRARVFAGRLRTIVFLSLLLTGLGAAGIGCSSSVTSAPVNNGTPLGVANLKITAAAYIDNTVVSHSVYLTVNVLPPGSTAAVRKSIARR